jgi:hypothetical protein
MLRSPSFAFSQEDAGIRLLHKVEHRMDLSLCDVVLFLALRFGLLLRRLRMPIFTAILQLGTHCVLYPCLARSFPLTQGRRRTYQYLV